MGSRYQTNKIYSRYSMNQFNTPGVGLLNPYWKDVAPKFDWTSPNNPNPVFLIRVEGSANKVQLYVRPTEYDGFRSLKEINNISAFTPNQTGAWFQIGGFTTNMGVFQGDTNGAGKLIAMTKLGVAGHDYIEGVQYNITE